jgi:hypothetical protein
MSSRWRRFEVLLPLQFNDGREVPPEWLAEAVLEVVDHFGAACHETACPRGFSDTTVSAPRSLLPNAG